MKAIFCTLLVAVLCLAAETKLGKPLALTSATPIADITSNPAPLLGKTVQVKGKITEVCQSMGCWMMLVDPGTKAAVKIKVKDGEIVFPKDSVGKMAVAEGTLAKIEMTREQALAQAKHEAEENHKKFDPASVRGPVTTYQIQGTGAVILQ
jgi:hypothetical protein